MVETVTRFDSIRQLHRAGVMHPRSLARRRDVGDRRRVLPLLLCVGAHMLPAMMPQSLGRLAAQRLDYARGGRPLKFVRGPITRIDFRLGDFGCSCRASPATKRVKALLCASETPGAICGAICGCRLLPQRGVRRAVRVRRDGELTGSKEIECLSEVIQIPALLCSSLASWRRPPMLLKLGIKSGGLQGGVRRRIPVRGLLKRMLQVAPSARLRKSRHWRSLHQRG